MSVASVFRTGLFKRQVAIVTGGGSGIGAAIALELASLGADVVIASRDTDKLATAAKAMNSELSERKADGSVVAQRCNIRSETEVAELIDTTLDTFGKLDFLVNNGGGQFPCPVEGIPTKGWHAVVETNLTGTFQCSREAYNKYMSEHGGAIVNIVADMFNGFPGMAHTGASRAGVVNLTKTMAMEWAPSGVRVNSIAPGVIYSDSAAANYDGPLLESAKTAIPAKRLGTVEEVSAGVCYLLSPAAAYISGTTLRIDGGASLWRRTWEVPDHSASKPYGELPDKARL